MAEAKRSAFRPNYAVPPGETLKETIASMGIPQVELAQRTGRPKKTINEIIKGKAAINPDTAIQLERVLGVPASFWNNLERNYQETLACHFGDGITSGEICRGDGHGIPFHHSWGKIIK